jgi:Tol biopolymer transport system component
MKLALVAVLVVTSLAAGAGRSVAAGTAGASRYRILLVSDRDGTSRWYSVRPDGSGLAPLLPGTSPLRPVTVSGDGSTIAYRDSRLGIYVSRASGAGLRRLVRRARDDDVVLSRDGRRLAFTNAKGMWTIGTDGRRLRLAGREHAALRPHVRGSNG